MLDTTAATTVGPGAPARRGRRRAKPKESGAVGQRWWTPYIFMLPGFALFGIFFAWPAIYAIELAFEKYDIVHPTEFVGFDNFVALADDPNFIAALEHSFIFLIGLIPFVVILPLPLAVLVNQKIRGIQFFRAVYYLPAVTSMVAIGIAWKYVFNRQGVLDWVLLKLHILNHPIGWLQSPTWSLYALILVEGWSMMGYYMMIYLAGLQAIPTDLYEAATLDGAGAWKRMKHVTVPLMVPYIMVTMTLEMLGAMQVFTSVYVMTSGGPENHTLTLGFYIWQAAFQNYEFGYASAMGLVLWALLIILSFVNYRITRSRMVNP